MNCNRRKKSRKSKMNSRCKQSKSKRKGRKQKGNLNQWLKKRQFSNHPDYIILNFEY